MHTFRVEIYHEPDPSFLLILTLCTVTAVNKAGLADVLDDADETLTLVAPTNTAFSKLPDGLVAKLLKPIWKPQLVDLLLYLLLGEEVLVPYNTRTYETLNEESIVIKKVSENGSTYSVINDYSRIETKDLPASNGYLNVINTVLTPASVGKTIVDIVLGDEQLATLYTALDAAGLVDTLDGEGPFTVFGEHFFFSSSILSPSISSHTGLYINTLTSPLYIAFTNSPDRRRVCRITQRNP